MFGRQFTGDTFKLAERGGGRRESYSQIVGITNKKTYGENKLTGGDEEGEMLRLSLAPEVFWLICLYHLMFTITESISSQSNISPIPNLINRTPSSVSTPLYRQGIREISLYLTIKRNNSTCLTTQYTKIFGSDCCRFSARGAL